MSENPIILGRRNCVRCTRWKLAVDFKWRWRRRRTAGSGPKPRALTPTIDAVCASCRRAEERARYWALSEEERRAKGVQANRQAVRRQAKQHEVIKRAQRAARTPRGHLPLVPFRMWLLGKARLEGGTSALARQLDMDEKNVRRWLHGYDWDNDEGWGGWAKCEPRPVYSVDVGTVDAAGVALGEPDLLERLYPYADGETT
jgi:hypothetical protein